jgi:hypothetical protein
MKQGRDSIQCSLYSAAVSAEPPREGRFPSYTPLEPEFDGIPAHIRNFFHPALDFR